MDERACLDRVGQEFVEFPLPHFEAVQLILERPCRDPLHDRIDQLAQAPFDGRTLLHESVAPSVTFGAHSVELAMELVGEDAEGHRIHQSRLACEAAGITSCCQSR